MYRNVIFGDTYTSYLRHPRHNALIQLSRYNSVTELIVAVDFKFKFIGRVTKLQLRRIYLWIKDVRYDRNGNGVYLSSFLTFLFIFRCLNAFENTFNGTMILCSRVYNERLNRSPLPRAHGPFIRSQLDDNYSWLALVSE